MFAYHWQSNLSVFLNSDKNQQIHMVSSWSPTYCHVQYSYRMHQVWLVTGILEKHTIHKKHSQTHKGYIVNAGSSYLLNLLSYIYQLAKSPVQLVSQGITDMLSGLYKQSQSWTISVAFDTQVHYVCVCHSRKSNKFSPQCIKGLLCVWIKELFI